jgi:altronate dehydratase
MFSEVTEVRDAIHLLTRRAINEEVGGDEQAGLYPLCARARPD